MDLVNKKKQIIISLALVIILTASGVCWLYRSHLHQERLDLFLSIKECIHIDVSFYDGKSIGLVIDNIGFIGRLGSEFGNLESPLWGEQLTVKLEHKLIPSFILRCWNDDHSLYVNLNLNIIYDEYGAEMLTALEPAIFYFNGDPYVVTAEKQLYTLQDKDFFPELLEYLAENYCPGIGLKAW